MYRLAYIAPVLTCAFLLVHFQDYEQWWIYAVMAAVSALLLWLAMRRGTRTKEYLSAYAISIVHHEPWVERVTYQETYTDSKGNSRTRTKVRYVHHPDVWFMPMNTGVAPHISRSTYDYYRRLWGTPVNHIHPFHPNCVSGGGGQEYYWDRVYENAATHTYKGLYVNYVKYSDSIFNERQPSKEEIEEYGLVDYPDFSSRHLETEAVLVSPLLPIESSDDLNGPIWLFNAYYGESNQIHVFIILFDAAKGVETALKQRALWRGGNKNEFTVCLGLENGKDVKWCKAFSWCDTPSLEAATESWFIENPVLDINAYAEWLRNNVGLWKRKEFKDFAYLGKSLSPTAKWLITLLTIALCVAAVLFTIYGIMPTPPTTV